MPTMSRTRRFLLLGVLGLAALYWSVSGPGRGDQPKADADKPKAGAGQPKADPDKPKAGGEKPKADADKPKAGADKPKAGADKPKAGEEPEKGKGGLTKLYFGSIACAECHDREKARTDDKFPPLCRCTEVGIWKKEDKHKVAYNALTGDRGQQMAKLLQKDVTKAEAGCLGCHAVLVSDAKLADKTFDIKEGVSCVACHGAHEEWVALHGSPLQRNREKWRSLPRDSKEQDYGMKDLWDPAKRTALCVSCHIGNTEEGKVVGHAMYAAGHPPLPSVEIATFSDDMPKHWQYLKEKPDAVQKLLQFTPKQAQFERTKLVMVSGVASLRGELHMIASEADAAAKAKESESRILDLAQYDCFACHHELKTPSYRVERGFPGTPGRPNFRPWPLALVRVGLEQTGHKDEQEFQPRLKKLYQAFDVRPFGDAAQIATASRDLAKSCDQLIADLMKVEFDETIALTLLQRLCKLAETEFPDYDTARQMAWAFRTIYHEWNPKGTEAVTAELDALDKELKLQLPSTQDKDILKDLPIALQKRGAYDPGPFQKHFQALSKQLVTPK